MAEENEDIKVEEETKAVYDEAVENSEESVADDTGKENDDNISEIDTLKNALAEEKDRSMRLYADFENFRRRTAKERSETFVRAEENVILDILPVVDNFTRAIAQAGDDPFSQGVKMVFEQFVTFLNKKGVAAIDALDKEFNPAEHEAVAYQPSPDKAEGIIIYETRKGYKMGDKVIRPSSVVVSSGAPTEQPEAK